MVDAVRQFDGTVTQFRGDGLMAVFGAPVAGEESARRAVVAALRMRDGLNELGVRLLAAGQPALAYRIGLNTGPVIVGRVADDDSMDYTAIGDTVNLAARMEQWAQPGHIYITSNTQRLVHPHVELKDLGLLEVKGMRETVHCFDVVRELPQRTRLDVAASRGLTPYVGRSEELSIMRGYFDQARRGQGQVVFLSADAGMGKSRLMLEFRRSLADVPHRWLEGHCSSYGRGMPYLPIMSLLKDAFGVEDTDSEAEIVARVSSTVSTWDAGAQRAAPYLRVLLNVDPGDVHVAEMDPRERRAGTLDALRTLVLQQCSQAPLVILMEDLHWADERSREALSAIIDVVSSAPVLLVVTYRPGEAPTLGERAFYNRISLQQLAAAESVAIIDSLLSHARLPQALQKTVIEKSDGNPFYVEEITRSLVESGALRPSNGSYTLAKPVDEVRLPDTIHEVILTRIDRLNREAREALQLASVIGREFTVRLLGRISHLEDHLDGLLGELKTLELIYEKAYFPELSYMFKHALTHEVAQSTLLEARRRELHRIVANAIEEIYHDRLPEHFDVLAHHFYQGAEWAKARDYVVKAAAKAEAAFANLDAAELYGRAVEIGTAQSASSAELSALYARRARCHLNLGQWAPARADAEQALALGDPGPSAARAEILLDHADAAFWLLDAPSSRASSEGALSIAGEIGDPGLRARANAMLAATRSADGNLDQGLVLFRDAVAQADELNNTALLPQVVAFYGLSLYWIGKSEAAIEGCRATLQVARQLGDVNSLITNMSHLGLALASAGRYREALETFEEACDIGRTQAIGTLLARCIAMQGGLYLDLFDYAGARRVSEDARARALSLEFPPPLVSSSIDLLFNMARSGDLSRADSLVEEIAEIVRVTGGWHGWLWKMRFAAAQAELCLARGQFEQAIIFADDALAQSQEKHRGKYSVNALISRGRALNHLSRPTDAVVELGRALALALPSGDPALILGAAAAADEGHADSRAAGHARTAAAAIRHELPDGSLKTAFLASPVARRYLAD
jgi:tetratricopeptide (TPR) repeat protein